MWFEVVDLSLEKVENRIGKGVEMGLLKAFDCSAWGSNKGCAHQSEHAGLRERTGDRV